MADEVKLYRTWSSPFGLRIVWALHIKGIEYEAIFEDLTQKSSELLQYNPVHKKIPVLVHKGKPICESLVILEYIDETWKETAPLLPQDPYEKAMARFWAKFVDDKLLPSVWSVFTEKGYEAKKEAFVPAVQNLEIIEEQLKEKKFFGGESIGYVDLVLGWMAYLLDVFEEDFLPSIYLTLTLLEKKMASFAIEDFVGNGSLQGLVPKLLEEGWDDVPTLKTMNADDMNELNMTQRQKDALEIRSYLHNRALMQYADMLEESGKSLPELLKLTKVDLTTVYGMKRGHVARFTDRTTTSGGDTLPEAYNLQASRRTALRNESLYKDISTVTSRKQTMTRSFGRTNTAYDVSLEQSMADFKIKDGHVFKGIVASMPDEPRACGCVQATPVIENVAPYSSIENISVQKLTPEYKIGTARLVKSKSPPMKASELWRDKPAVIICIRRPGCIMCRAEAHQLYAKKPIFDALGVQLFAVLHEQIEAEVKDFWPRYWGGVVLFDRSMEFYKSLGGGNLLKDKFISGFLFNPRAIANYKRAKSMGVEQNFRGEGEIKGGLYIVGRGKSGIAYQFIERNFGDWAPHAEVFEICHQLQNPQGSQLELPQSIQQRD